VCFEESQIAKPFGPQTQQKINSVAFSPQAKYTDRGRRLSEKLVQTFAVRECHVVSSIDLFGF
jgi:hypothetical protein